MKKVEVKQIEGSEVAAEVLAEAIISISKGVKALRASRLTDRTLCMLIADASPSYGQYPKKQVSQRDVKAVLDGMAALEATHLKKPPTK